MASVTKHFWTSTDNEGFAKLGYSNWEQIYMSNGTCVAYTTQGNLTGFTLYSGTVQQGATTNTYAQLGVPVGATILGLQLTNMSSAVVSDGGSGTGYLETSLITFYCDHANFGQFETGGAASSDYQDVTSFGLTSASYVKFSVEAQATTSVIFEPDYFDTPVEINVSSFDIEIFYSLAVEFSGSITGAISVGGALTVRKDLAGSPTGSVAFAGTMSTQKNLSGSPTGSVAFTGSTLTNYEAVNLSGSPTGSVAFTGSISVRKDLSGTPSSSIAFAGFLTNNDPTNIQFSGSPTGSIAFAGATSVQKDFSGSPTGSVSFTGTLTTASFMSGGVTSSVAFAGAISTEQGFTGAVTASIALAGLLTTRGAYEPVGNLKSTLLHTGVCTSTLIDTVEHKEMGNTFYVKKGDNAQTIRTRLADAEGEINLTSCTAKVQFRKKGNASVTLEPTATVEPNQTAFTGEVEYAFSPTDFNTLVVGEYEVEWKITFPNGTIRNFPTSRIPTRNYNYLVVYENF